MWDFVQITAQYSNAVMVAVLPHVSDFAQKLDLPIHTPIAPSEVRQFKCDPRKDHVGGAIILTNDFQFTFLDGRVCVYRSPQSYYSLQEPELIPKFYGKVKVREKAALQIARDAVKKLGFASAELHADSAPEITPPEKMGFNDVPRYRFRWIDPNSQDETKSRSAALLDMEVNASNKRIEMFVISSAAAHRANPRIDVEPPLQRASESETQPAQPKAFWMNKDYALAILKATLPQFSEFVTNAGVSVKVPVTLDDVDLSRYACVSDQGIPTLQVYLKNGDRFNYSHGHVTAFYGHDAFFKFPDIGKADDFTGTRMMSTNDAIALAKQTLNRLGYKGSPVERDPQSPLYSKSDRFTRYFVNFVRPNDPFEFASFEIDLVDKRIKAVYFDDPSLWRESPQVDVPATVQTNRPSFSHVNGK